MKKDCNNTEIYLSEMIRCNKTDHETWYQIACKDVVTNEGIKDRIAKIQAWSDSHEQKTYLEDFREKFPNMLMNSDGTPKLICQLKLYEGRCCYKHNMDCLECWNKIMEDKQWHL